MNGRSILLSLGLATIAAALAACPSFDYDAGRWACDVDADCPGGQVCNVDAGVCTTDDGGGGSGSGGDSRCLAHCRSLLPGCNGLLQDRDCVTLCTQGTTQCRSCAEDAVICPDLAECENICLQGGGGGGGGGPTGCELTCQRINSECGSAENTQCLACCGQGQLSVAGGLTCNAFIGRVSCDNVPACEQSCAPVGG